MNEIDITSPDLFSVLSNLNKNSIKVKNISSHVSILKTFHDFLYEKRLIYRIENDCVIIESSDRHNHVPLLDSDAILSDIRMRKFIRSIE